MRYGARNPLKTPTVVPKISGHKISVADKVEIAKTVADADNKKYIQKRAEIEYKKGIEEDFFQNFDTHKLVAITKMKKLTAYIMTITAKSPQRYRFTFVNRMQNLCLDIITDMFKANSLNKADVKNKYKCKELQHNAYENMQILGYIAFVAYENMCILKKQYEEISLQLSNCINLLVAWTKSENE